MITLKISCFREIPAFAGVMSFGKRQNKGEGKLKRYIPVVFEFFNLSV